MTLNTDPERVIEPHRYQRPAVSHWRTCAICGQGANAKIHRPIQDEVDAISGSAYTHRLP